MRYETRCKTGRTSAKVRATMSRQNFSQRHIRSFPVDPKLMFWCVSYYLSAFGTVWLPYETRCKTGRTSAKVRARSRVGIFRNECTRSIPVDPKLMFWCVLFYLGALRTIRLRYEIWCKQAELVQKFVPRSRVETFCNELTRSTPLDPRLMFSCISYYFIAIGTVWLCYETRWKTGRTRAKVRAMKSRRNFPQRTHPVHRIGP